MLSTEWTSIPAAFDRHLQTFTAAQLGEPLEYGQACYDATWILALALNNTLTGMQRYDSTYTIYL